MSRTAAPGAARPLLLRRMNERTVLETIRERAPISRAEIARTAGISKPTVSLALQALLDAGLVRETGPASEGPTFGATFFEADPDAAAIVAVDIGARYMRVAVADVSGAVRAREDVRHDNRSLSSLLRTLPAATRRVVAAAGVAPRRLACAVAGVPGVVDPATGKVSLAENVPGLDGSQVAPRIQRVLGVETVAFNDVNLAALGEREHGVAQGVENFVFVSIGTGLGAGVVVAGELLAGNHGAAGELDFARGERAGDDPAAPAISDYAAQAVRTAGNVLTKLRPPYDTISVFELARAGDPVALAVVDEVARRICVHLFAIVAVVDPELVVLGGGIGSNADLLLPRVRERLTPVRAMPPRVEVSALGGDAVLAGAIAIGVGTAREVAFERGAA